MTIKGLTELTACGSLLICALLALLPSNTNAQESHYEGKMANFVGDSITQAPNSYVNEVKKLLGLKTARNYGIGGGALCHRNSIERFKDRLFGGKKIDVAYPPVVSRWDKMDNDADFIFMLIGTNDYSSGVPMGSVDSVNKSEFNGSLNIVLRGLKKKYPGKLIVVSTLLKRRSGGARLLPYNDAIQKACERHGVVCYDAHSEVGLDFGQELYDKAMKTTTDGLHPNAVGAKIIGQKIAEFISANRRSLPR
jgi:hypothetical protein